MGWTQREDTPRKLNKVNKEEWKKVFMEFRKSELYARSPSLSLYIVFTDWLQENYQAPDSKQLKL